MSFLSISESNLINSILNNPEEDFHKIVDLIEKKIKQSVDKYKSIYENAIEGVCIVDPLADITFINQRMTEISGYSSEEMIGNSIFSLIDQEEARNFKNRLESHKRGISEKYEAKLSRKNGEEVYVKIKATLQYDENGNYDGSVVFIEDITEKRRNEQFLRESEEKYRTLIEGLTQTEIGVDIVDLNHNVIYQNDFLRGRFGYHNGRKCYEHYLGRENSCKICPMEKAINTNKVEKEMIITPENRIYEITSAPLPDKDGKVDRAAEVIIDITERRQVVADLKREKLFIEEALNAQRDTFFVFEPSSGKAIRWNKAFREISGYSDEEILAMRAPDSYYDEKSLQRAAETTHLIEEKSASNVKMDLINKDGNSIPFEYIGSSITDEEGNLKYIVSVGRDITDRKKAEQKLKESEEKYRSLFENSPIALMDQDFSEMKKYVDHLKATGIKDFKKYFEDYPKEVLKFITKVKLIDVNRKTLEVYKFNTKEHFISRMNKLGEGLENKMTEEIFLDNKREILALINGDTMYESEISSTTSLGELMYLYAKTSIVSGFESTWSKVIVSILDITDRKNAEKNLRESEEKYRNLVETSSMGLLEIDFSTKDMVYINPKLLGIIGYKYEELSIERGFQKFIHPEDLKEMDFSRAERKLEFRVLTKNGKIKWLSGDRFHYHDENGNLDTVRLWLQDITEKKELEQIKANLLIRFSHEFKTPLISIKGFADLLLEEYRDKLNEKIVSFLEKIKEGAITLNSLTNRFIESSKLDDNLVIVNIKRVNIAKLINRVLIELEGVTKSRQHIIDLRIEKDLLITCDPEKIHMVISNLMLNASKFTPQGGLIMVSTTIKNGFVIISIKDNGIGFKKEELERLFKPFGKIERYGQGLDIVPDGMGMGLYITKGLVELHKGMIWVESAGRNKGSIFNVKIPINLQNSL